MSSSRIHARCVRARRVNFVFLAAVAPREAIRPHGPTPRARGFFTRVRVLAFTRLGLRVVSGGAAPKCEGLLCLDQKPLVINDATLPSTDSKVE